jgi:hypothetical protein
MQVKYLAAAIAALSTTAAFATPLDTQTAVVAADHVVYIGGASAQKVALDTLMHTNGRVFTTGADVVKITGPNSSIGYLGVGVSDSQNLLVIYNSTNGSAAGLNQLLSVNTAGVPSTYEAEANVLALTGSNNSCSTVGGSSGAYSATCTGAAIHEIDMALSDVFANEFGSSGSLCKATGSGCPAPSYLGLSSIKSAVTLPAAAKSTGLEGFGIIVNANLYNDLLAQNVAEGLLSSTCSTHTAVNGATGAAIATTADCQPSIRSRDYAELVTKGANGWDASVLLGGLPPAALDIGVHRRDELSGTQAASNIFFLNNICGSVGYKGSQVPARALTDDIPASAGVNAAVKYYEETATGNVETNVGNEAGYGIGVVSTGEKDAIDDATRKYWFVKIDNVSPNVYNGAYDSTHKKTLLNGSYTFATEMAAYVRTSVSGLANTVTKAVANGMSDSVLTPAGLNGIGFLDQYPLGWTNTGVVQAKYSRGGNNCAPLH